MAPEHRDISEVEPTAELYELWHQLLHDKECSFEQFVNSVEMMKREKPFLLVMHMNAIEKLKHEGLEAARGFLHDQKMEFAARMRIAFDKETNEEGYL